VSPPARAAGFLGTLAVALAGCMAVGGRGGGVQHPQPERLTPVVVNAPNAPALDGFSGAVKVGFMMYLSGQVALDSAGHVVGPDDLRVQLRQALQNMAALVKVGRGSPGDIVQLTVYTVDYTPNHVEMIREAATEVLSAEARPAVTVVGVARLPLPELLVAVDGIAWLRGALPDRHRAGS
jgi:enamine deaminase RidA (YjgF/YER057c/UK114 family)